MGDFGTSQVKWTHLGYNVHMLEKFGERLKSLREDRELSKREFAKLFHVSHSTITRWENGLQAPNITYLYQLVKFFNVSADYFIGIED